MLATAGQLKYYRQRQIHHYASAVFACTCLRRCRSIRRLHRCPVPIQFNATIAPSGIPSRNRQFCLHLPRRASRQCHIQSAHRSAATLSASGLCLQSAVKRTLLRVAKLHSKALDRISLEQLPLGTNCSTALSQVTITRGRGHTRREHLHWPPNCRPLGVI